MIDVRTSTIKFQIARFVTGVQEFITELYHTDTKKTKLPNIRPPPCVYSCRSYATLNVVNIQIGANACCGGTSQRLAIG